MDVEVHICTRHFNMGKRAVASNPRWKGLTTVAKRKLAARIALMLENRHGPSHCKGRQITLRYK